MARSPRPRSFSPATGSSTVESTERAYAIAARASAAPGKGGVAVEHADRGARSDERAARGRVTRPSSSGGLYRPRTCCASLRRRFSAPSSGASATSPPPRTPCRRRCSRRAAQWPRRGRAGQPARLADPGRRAAHDRSPARRAGAAAARSGRRRCRRRTTARRFRRTSGSDGARRAGRHAHPALHVLPSGAHASIGDCADAAGGRRPDDGRDRQRVPGARSDDGAADQPRQADASRRPACRSACRPTRSAPNGSSAVLHVLYLIFNEGYASSIGPDLQRSDLSNEAIRLTRAVHHLLPDDGEVGGTAGADAADRCPARGADRDRTAS